MKFTLDILSNNEYDLYKGISFQVGTFEHLTEQLTQNGTFDKYREIHRNYYELYITTADEATKLETLKRLIFLNWYSIIEPNCFTGIINLDDKIVFNSFSILNEYIRMSKLDKEFIWMLSYYSCWEWAILPLSQNKLNELTNFVKNVDTSILYVPKHQLLRGIMDNRGQMGFYWKSCSVEK